MPCETLAVIGCGDAKREEATKARDLYTSNYFALKREYADHFADRVVILSAEHGLVWSKRTIEPYDTTLDDRDRDALVDGRAQRAARARLTYVSNTHPSGSASAASRMAPPSDNHSTFASSRR